jgi:hypothetical protein
MAFSGTVSQTTFSTRRVLESAARRCRIQAPQLTAEYVDIAKDQLYLLLSDLANQGAPLWCITKSIYGLYEGEGALQTFLGTVDVLTTSAQTGTNTDSSTQRTVAFATATDIVTVGIKWSAVSAPLEFARSDDGAIWDVIQTETPSASSGEWSWFDLNSVIPAVYFRVRATSGVLSFSEIYLGNSPSEIPMARVNRDDYTALPNKTFTSNRPLQYWLDRQAQAPIMRLWPCPSAAAEHSQIVLWAHRHIMDVGTLAQELEVPQRWYEAVVAGLASKLALEFPDVDPQMIPLLDGKAAQSLYIAQQEERDNSPISLMPDFACYTR